MDDLKRLGERNVDACVQETDGNVVHLSSQRLVFTIMTKLVVQKRAVLDGIMPFNNALLHTAWATRDFLENQGVVSLTFLELSKKSREKKPCR